MRWHQVLGRPTLPPMDLPTGTTVKKGRCTIRFLTDEESVAKYGAGLTFVGRGSRPAAAAAAAKTEPAVAPTKTTGKPGGTSLR
jgi:hypothetical protein